MSFAENISSEQVSIFDSDTQKFYAIQFWTFLGLMIPSIFCALFSLHYLLQNRNPQKTLYNHTIIVILILSLLYQSTDMSLYIYYFRSYQTFIPTPTMRLIWGCLDYTVYFVQVELYVWVTIERHILIFHKQLVSTRKKRLFIHYLPPILISIYGIVYFTATFFVFPCENYFENLIYPSFIPCAFADPILGLYETLINEILPIFIIVISSIALLIRTVRQRYHVQRQVQWRQYRKMTCQVLIISTIFLVFPFPYVSITLLHLCGMPSDIGAEFSFRAMYFTYYTLFLFPMATLGSLPELRQKIRNVLRYYCRRNVIGVVYFHTNQATPR